MNRRRLLSVTSLAIMWMLIVITSALIASVGLRDRFLLTQFLMFVPLPFVAGVLIVWMLVQRQLRGRRRWCIVGGAGLCLLLSMWPMIGTRSVVTPNATPITLVHWNVLWGGWEPSRDWPRVSEQMLRLNPDVIVLSEAPSVSRIDAMLPTGWSKVAVQHAPRDRYTYRLAVLARGTTTLERQADITGGKTIVVRVELDDGRTIRVLVVDGLSTITQPRAARTRDVERLAREAAERGQPIDIIAGDFNTQARSIGIAQLEDSGWSLASRHARGQWRGTFPRPLPLWDIDHVLISPAYAVTSAEMLSASGLDHRGQLVQFAPK